MPAIHADGLTKYYGETRGIEDLDLDVQSGEIFGFLGPNGAGKTTTIRTLLGFMAPTSGTAAVLGQDVTDESSLLQAKADVGFLPGDPAFDDGVTGQRYLDLHASLKGDERRGDLLEIFDPPLERKIGEYSRGNRQMLGLIQAFMHDPDLVVMDEPTSGLDPLKQERFNDFVEAETDRGTTVFFSSHVLSEVRKVCDRVGIIRNGHLVEVAEVGDLLERSGRLVTVSLETPPGPEAFAIDGVHDRSVDGSRVRFMYTGSYDALVDALDQYAIVDLEIQEAPLEDVFMRFYNDTGEWAEATTAPRSAADESGGGRDV
ncbi:ATP-binding cassette domain-containing protein [Halobacteriales archaeon Cl-PHB]